MRFCTEHWSQLRTALTERGLMVFVSGDGEEAARRLVENEFDPLMMAHNALISNLLGAGGIETMLVVGDGCPLCHALMNCGCVNPETCSYATWINRAADDALAVARERGLVVSS